MRTIAIFGDSNTNYGNILNLHYFYDIPSEFTLINCAIPSMDYEDSWARWTAIAPEIQQSVDLVIIGSHGNSMKNTGTIRDSLIANLAWYQSYIDQIRATLNANAKILVCKTHSHYDGATTPSGWTYWDHFNNLIVGIPDPGNEDLGIVTGVDYRDGEAEDKMTDVNGDIIGIYGRVPANAHAAYPGTMLMTLRWKKYIDLIPNN